MIPARLTLRNFMSYGDEPATLDFTDMHVVCLSGDNGNGKSALLDAITWALWGKTRASSVRSATEDDLIRVGADEMEVSFEFFLNDQRYRVVKKRRRGKSSASEWHLAQQIDSSGQWVSIGGSSQRETAQQIVKLLSMEYDTFVNSAYLQQGHADEFTRKTPVERKRILAEVLGLQRFDRLEALARARWQERKQEVNELENELRLLDAEIHRLPEYERELEGVRAEIQSMQQTLEQRTQEHEQLRERLFLLQAVEAQVKQHEAHIFQIERDLSQIRHDLDRQSDKLEQMADILAQRAAILQDYEAYWEAERQREATEPQVRLYEQRSKELQAIQNEIEREQVRLEGQRQLLRNRLQTLEQNVCQLQQTEQDLQQIATTLAQSEALEAQWQEVNEALERHRDHYASLKSRNEQLKEDLREVDEVLELLARPYAACPVCMSDLSGEKHAQLLARQQQKKTALLEAQAQVKQEGHTVKQAIAQLEQQFQELQSRRYEQMRYRARQQELLKQRYQLAGALTERDQVQSELEALTRQLEQGDFAAPQRAQVRMLQAELGQLQQAREQYERAQTRVRQLRDAPQRYQQLQTVDCNMQQELQRQQQLQQRLAEKQQERTAMVQQCDALRTQLAEYDTLRQEVSRAEQLLQEAQEQMHALQRKEGGLLSSIEGGKRALEQRRERETRQRQLAEEAQIYQKLTTAFGKGGIQTYIIENVIPELEEEANALLARMTDTGMSLRFETTRAGKTTRQEIETLDIKVLDDAGSRPYELFSGGEALRINFAIRVALSRLLARRSGARLQTLIVDEGFGSQDSKARERLVQLIHTIQSDFALILVITHFEELKERFPSRIEVIKEASGSRIHVL
ncbi:MAG: SMC family ATPase [Chloroherpetonaceae bacterium]|nr:SMC family ATPase [Chthonomonadaceae bacterium]MDW8208798.1 SMC family ATPase [Chloroherpetonaceae bacterium]